MRLAPVLCLILSAAAAPSVDAQELKPAGTVLIPESSLRQVQPFAAFADGTAHAYTNVTVFVPATPIEPPTAASTPPAPYFIETPASIACAYGLVSKTDGCNPNLVHTNPSGGGKVIVIVDAFDAPNIAGDLKVFSERFNLPAADFSVVFADGTRPAANKGWELEISLDVEWAHAIAPDAKIVLVEAANSQYTNLFAAVDKAADIVAQAGGGEVSLSWGGAEFQTEASNDPLHFAKPGVVYFAATGDEPGVNYPSSSAQIVAVGGTTIVRDASGSLVGEKPWVSAGAGPSLWEKRPIYQNPLSNVLQGVRGVADLAAVADPQTGVWIYDSGNSGFATNHGWTPIGGTSAATPIAAAIANLGGRFAPSSIDELTHIYSNSTKFNKILPGTCGPAGVYSSAAGWNFCTGLGSPSGKGSL